jgi:Transcriptional Coactivator p15 (PC4)
MSGRMNHAKANMRARAGRERAEAVTAPALDAATMPAKARGGKRGAAPLAEPVTVATCWKNRGGDAVYVRLTSYKVFNLIDIRNWRADAQGISQPGKGIALQVKHLPWLHAAIGQAMARAKELGLIDDESGGRR